MTTRGALVAGACALMLVALVPLPARATESRCNGEEQLCGRSLGDVAFATTHNSMASTANGFVPPNQRRSMGSQLEHGIRAFQIDAFSGTPRGNRVYTDLSGPLGQAAELPPAAVRSAQLLHRRLGAPPAGTPYDVYLCHVFCELGAVRMLDEMQVVRTFLDAHPREVLVMVIEDYVAPEAILEVLREAGLESELLPVDPGAPLPTLEQMIERGTRIQVSLENGALPPTLPNAFTGLVEETPFTFRRPRNLERPSSCIAHRGTDGAPLFQFNHWVTPAEPVTAPRVNTSILRQRLAECTRVRHRGPTLVAVDFAEQGDVLGVVERLNRYARYRPSVGLIDPMPPVTDAALPWDREVADPVATLAAARATCGDTFVVDGPDRPTLFLFSPEGVRSFYALPETTASKGVADWMMLRRKLPDELFDGRRTMPHQLFGRDDVRSYLTQLDAAIDVAFAELGDEGTVDVFAFSRRLGHRMGLAAWAGETPARTPRFDELVEALDELDGSAAFVHPEAMAAVAGSGKQAELAAMTRVEALVTTTVRDRDSLEPGTRPHDLFTRVMSHWDGVDEPARTTGIARDVILVHLASMSNLFAATGWMLGQLVLHPDVSARVRAGEAGLLERCALESTRLGQRSVMLRAVLAPCDVRDEQHAYRVEPGAQIATLLPLTNTTAAPGLDTYDPDRWSRRRLLDEAALPARELVTTFGHGEHTCPAQPFSLAAMCRSAERLLTSYDLESASGFTAITPLSVQIGGVARSERPCEVRYRVR